MNQSTDADDRGERPRILRGLLIAAAVAAVLLLVVVLPAERGWDPTGIGRLLGLTAMNSPQQRALSIDDVIEDVTAGNDNLTVSDSASFDEPIPLPNPAIHQASEQPARIDTFNVTLPVDGMTEIKTVMRKAKVFVYEWSVDDGEVYVDFHGHDPAKGDYFWVRYEEVDGTTGASGSLVAPFDGEHGWFWLNISDKPVTIHLKVTGFQDDMRDYGLIQ
ncbi:MAG: hypothetical protein LBE59_12620 [Nevskiaceae bacterium]|jgi:hypothetical protein|nr:hypothetical protein [Nevskiaceae bacterium]